MAIEAGTRPLLPELFSDRAVCVMTRVGQTLSRLITGRLQPLGLKLRHYTVLRALAAEGAMSQGELGDLLTLDPATIATTVDELEKRDLVARSREPQNRRKYAVTITAAGRRVLRRAERAFDELEAEVLDDLDPDERHELARLVGVLAYGEGYPALAAAEGATGGRRA